MPSSSLTNLNSAWLKSKYSEEMTEVIGRGGFATVFSFVDPKTKETKALKLIKRDENVEKSKWFEEAQSEIDNMLLLNQCEHVLRLQDQFIDVKNNRLFLVFELAKGSLEKIPAKLTYAELLGLTNSLLKSLHFAHENKIVHRDLKPANILISQSGIFLVSDWGISRNMASSGTLSHAFTAKGTAGWIAPDFRCCREIH